MINIAMTCLDSIFFVHVKQSDVCLKREAAMPVVIGKTGLDPDVECLDFRLTCKFVYALSIVRVGIFIKRWGEKAVIFVFILSDCEVK